MFNTKQTKLFDSTKVAKKSTVQPIFVQQALKKSVETLSGNGAKKLSSTLNSFVDQFGKLGTYKSPRTFNEISKDCELLWAQDKLDAVKFIHYLRTIPRKVSLLNGQTTSEAQLGGELKHEPLMRMIWLSQKAPEIFWKNIGLYISLGSWHDVFSMLQYDLVYNGWENRKLDWNKFGNLILSGLENENCHDLVKKYLPQIKSKSVCKTVESQANCMIAKWISSLLFGQKESSLNYKRYRKLKTSGAAHEWQKLISQRQFDRINFDQIHGRALNLLVRGKFLKNQNLSEKYAKWVGDPKTSVKYTGFVHELFSKLPYTLANLAKHEQDTINKQFNTLVEKANNSKKEKQCNWMPVIDTSGSMGSQCSGTTTSCLVVAKALALYFSEFLSGKFTGSFVEFNSTATMHTWKGNTPLEKWYNNNCSYVGSTNFQSVIDLFVTLKHNGIPEDDFPTGILCLSDSEFNPAQLGKTNVETARNKLRSAGFTKKYVDSFQIVLWNLQSSYYGKGTGEKFETTANEKGTFYFSGYSGSVISFLSGHEILTPEQLFEKAMDQQVLNMISL
jgi:hypothetical protein